MFLVRKEKEQAAERNRRFSWSTLVCDNLPSAPSLCLPTQVIWNQLQLLHTKRDNPRNSMGRKLGARPTSTLSADAIRDTAKLPVYSTKAENEEDGRNFNESNKKNYSN